MDTYAEKTLVSLLLVGIFVFLAIGSIDSNPSGTGDSSAGSTSSSSTMSDKNFVMRAQVLDFRLSITEINTIKANFTITNPTGRRYKDFEITCEHYSPSGTKIDSNTRTIYEIVEPNSKKTIRGFDMGFIHSQAKSSSCTITDLTVM